MALVDKGYAHFHHLAFETVDIGKQRDLLDHVARHGRWLGWGPTRHGIAGNIASYVRIVEEKCFVELYCDMEQLQDGHVPRVYPDDRYSSNTWGPLPPRSYFRFDEAAIESERQSLETLGIPLPPPPEESRMATTETTPKVRARTGQQFLEGLAKDEREVWLRASGSAIRSSTRSSSRALARSRASSISSTSTPTSCSCPPPTMARSSGSPT